MSYKNDHRNEFEGRISFSHYMIIALNGLNELYDKAEDVPCDYWKSEISTEHGLSDYEWEIVLENSKIPVPTSFSP